MARKRKPGPKQHPRPLADLLTGVLTERAPHRAEEARVHAIWKEVLQPPASLHARPLRVSGKILTLLVSSAGWAQEIAFFRDEIRKRICERLGEGTITDIRFQVGRIAREKPVAAPPPRPKLSEGVLQGIAADVESVEDPELRKAIAQARIAQAEKIKR